MLLSRLYLRPLPQTVRHPWWRQRCSRALWTATTDNHADLTTALANALHPLSSASSSSSTSTTATSSKNVAVILASRSYDGAQLLKLPSLVSSSIRASTTILAAVVNRVPTKSGHGVSVLAWSDTPSSSSSSSPSSPSESVVPFVLHGSAYQRKRLKEKSVGRWARPEDIEERTRLDTADAWDAFKSISISRNQVQLPAAVAHHLNEAQSGHTSQQQQVLILSDPEVHQFLDALDETLPQAHKAGLVVSSTPFITGERHTMFYNDELVQDGVIGLSIVSPSSLPSLQPQQQQQRQQHLTPPPLDMLSQPMVISRCRGNIILGLDAQDRNPTRALLEHLEGRSLQKTDEFYIATGPVQPDGQAIDLSAKETKLFKITGGDPSKGNMAVDTVHDLQNGQWVQFVTQKKGVTADKLSSPRASLGATQAVFQVDEVMIEDMSDGPVQDHKTDHGLFGGSSENGLMMGLPGDFTWVCPIPHTMLSHTIQETTS